MCSRIWGTGWSTLVRAGHRTTCLCYAKRVAQSVSLSRPGSTRVTPRLREFSGRRFKSSAALLRTVGPEGGAGAESQADNSSSSSGGGDKTQAQPGSDDLPSRKPIRVMVIRGASHLKPLRSWEAPVLHHAQAGAVVDMREDPAAAAAAAAASRASAIPASHTITTTTTTTHEIHLTVDQLLRESRKSVHIASHSHEGDEELDYNSERETRRPEEPELVGALPAGALDWRPQLLDVRKLGIYYADLAKSRLTGLVVLTAVAGYAMAPAPMEVSTLLLSALGTGLVSGAANTINQFLEVPFDSQMDRTKTRILVRGLVTPLHAISYAAVCSTAGIGMLYCGANGLAAALGAANLVLYTCVYTPMKRTSILNTWMGAIVGAIPPLIGWASCVGELGAGAWLMAAILYAWQFPHFNSLSWNLRPDYSRAGYRMMAVTDPDLCRRVSLRYSLAMVGICTLAPVMDVTTWTFAADSLPFNGYMVYLAWKFHQDADSKSSRKLFFFSLIHLPVILMLMIISKKHYGRDGKTEAVAAASEGGGVDVVTKDQIPSTLGT